jgi:hypothetical protein
MVVFNGDTQETQAVDIVGKGTDGNLKFAGRGTSREQASGFEPVNELLEAPELGLA